MKKMTDSNCGRVPAIVSEGELFETHVEYF